MSANEAVIAALRQIVSDCQHYKEAGYRPDFYIGGWNATIAKAEGFIAEAETGTADWSSVLRFVIDWREDFGRWMYDHIG